MTWIKPLVNVFCEDGRVLYEGVVIDLPEDEAQELLQKRKAEFAEPPEPEATPTDSGSRKAKTTVADSTTTPQTQG